MIPYLVNFTLCSGLLLAAYHLLLKNRTMYHFNRFYLLASLLFSFMVPLILIQRHSAPLSSFNPVQQQVSISNAFISHSTANAQPVTASSSNYRLYVCILVYGIVTLLLLTRFVKNLHTIYLTISRNENLHYQGARLVLIGQKLTPHTFLNFIFLSRDDYRQRRIEDDILHHELAHARQYHSADIILLELALAVCWFNPFLLLYRPAIQLNHEFIADSAALEQSNNLHSYQELLMRQAGQRNSMSITSRFNYSITKKRLIMMTKSTSPAAAWLSRLALIPVFALAFMLFCNKTDAQQERPADKQPAQADKANQKNTVVKVPPTLVSFSGRKYPSTKNGISAAQMKEYEAYEKKYATRRLDFSKTITKPEEKRMEQLFQQMSPAQQQNRAISFTYPPEPATGSPVTRDELNSWKNPSVYGVWLNGKRMRNSSLQHVNPENINKIFFSRLTDKAVKNDGFQYQVELMTLDYYKKYRQQAIANRNNSNIMFHLKS